MFCVYCGREHDGTVPLSDEDVIPYAIGGSRRLTIQTCAESNNRLGGTVDKPFIEFFPVRAQRFFLGLVGTDGTEPTFDLGGRAQIGGREVKIARNISKGGDALKIEPAVTRTPIEGCDRCLVTGDPEDVRRIIEGMLESQRAKGKWVKSAEGKILQPGDLDHLDQLPGACYQEILNPSVVKTVNFDPLWSIRFFTKLALSTGHYVLGETFSRSARADALRKAMSARDHEAATIKGAAIWPEVKGIESTSARFRREDSHVLVVCLGAPPIFFASLFGIFDAMVVLRDLEAGELPVASTQGRVLEVELPARTLRDCTLEAYVARRVSQGRPVRA